MDVRWISSAHALDMLETVAPRPWARRMLAWHVLETTGALIFTGGTLTEHASAWHVLKWEKEERHPDARPDAAAVTAAKKAGNSDSIQLDREPPEFPLEIPIELAVQLDHFDWESGTARGSFQYLSFLYLDGFEELQTFNKESWLQCDLHGLSFDIQTIEMLAPYAKAPQATLFEPKAADVSKARQAGPGRRRLHDWDGALLHLIGEAERNAVAPDPDAHGAQADISAMMADWFADQGATIPANSQLQSMAKRVLEHIRSTRPKA